MSKLSPVGTEENASAVLLTYASRGNIFRLQSGKCFVALAEFLQLVRGSCYISNPPLPNLNPTNSIV
jgi:hypothetical protein